MSENDAPSLKVILEPTHMFTLDNGKKQAHIDFEGETVIYTGELEVEESAKIFFDCVFKYYKQGAK